jgi:regulator of replication initiation timing
VGNTKNSLDILTTSENPNTQPVAHLDLTNAEYALAEYLEVDLKASRDALLARVQEGARRLLEEEIRMGLRLMALKERLGHGDFLPALAEIGVTNRSAQQAMQTARVFAAEGDARRRQQLLDMGKTKAVALLADKPEVREAILSDPELAKQAIEGSKREVEALRKQVRNLQENNNNLQMKLDESQRDRKRLTPFAPRTEEVRAECMALQREAEEPIDSLRQLFDSEHDGICQLCSSGSNAEEARLRAEHVWLAMNAVLARAWDAVAAMRESGIDLPDRLRSEHYLTRDEAVEWLRIGQEIQATHDAKKQQREKARAEEQPPKRGRKPGSKNKPKGA